MHINRKKGEPPMNQNKPTPVSFLQNKNRYDQGRYALLTVVILSLINLFSIVAIDRYYLFSSYITKSLGVKGAILYMDTGDVIFPILYGFIGFITVIPYFLCFLFSKKHVGWMIGALVLFSIDSACFLSEFILYVSVGELSTILDALVRVWVLVSLALGVKYGLRVNKDEKEMEVAEVPATELDYNPAATEDFDEKSTVTRMLTVTRAKSFVGCALKMQIFVNGKEVESLKNGETKSVQIDGREAELFILAQGASTSNVVQIPAGYDNKSYTFKCKMGFSAMKIILEEGAPQK